MGRLPGAKINEFFLDKIRCGNMNFGGRIIREAAVNFAKHNRIRRTGRRNGLILFQPKKQGTDAIII